MIEKIKQNKILSVLIALIVVSTLLSVFGSDPVQFRGTTAVSTTASTTAYALTGTSQRVLATTTKRSAIHIQVACANAGAVAHFNFEDPDAAATTANGLAVPASTTASFVDTYDLPVNTNAVQGITTGGNCTANITEWTTSF